MICALVRDLVLVVAMVGLLFYILIKFEKPPIVGGGRTMSCRQHGYGFRDDPRDLKSNNILP